MTFEESKEKYPIAIELIQKCFPNRLGLTAEEWELVYIGTNNIAEKVFEATKKACADNAEVDYNIADDVSNELGTDIEVYLITSSILNIKIEDLEL